MIAGVCSLLHSILRTVRVLVFICDALTCIAISVPFIHIYVRTANDSSLLGSTQCMCMCVAYNSVYVSMTTFVYICALQSNYVRAKEKACCLWTCAFSFYLASQLSVILTFAKPYDSAVQRAHHRTCEVAITRYWMSQWESCWFDEHAFV